jgi:hypothetical protein
MKSEQVDKLLAGADAQLSRAIEGLITLDSRHADYALALDEATGQLLRLKSMNALPGPDREGLVLACLQNLSSKAATASRLLDSAASLYLAQAGIRANTQLGYNADGGADLLSSGGSLRMEA